MSGLTDRLRQVAGQATPGPWWHSQPLWLEGVEHEVVASRSDPEVAFTSVCDITHIATFDPLLVGAMLDVIDAAEALVDAPRGSPNGEGLGRAKVRDRLARFREVAG